MTTETRKVKRDHGGGGKKCRDGNKQQDTGAMKGEMRNVGCRASTGEGGGQYGRRVIEEG